MNLYYKTICLLITFFSFTILYGQDTTIVSKDTLWKTSGSGNISFSNVGLSNWAGGGQNSISIGGILDGKAVRESNKSKWLNYLNFAYGIAKLGSKDNLFKKTDDQLVLGSKYDFKFNKYWSMSAYMELRTQVANGYTFRQDADGKEIKDQLVSRFFAPGYIFAGLGITYQNKVFSATFAPFSYKLTMVLEDSLSDAGAFGVAPGKKSRSELGPSFTAKLDTKILENVNFKSSLNLFADYTSLGTIDTFWETLLVFKVNKFINTSFGTTLIYDNDVLIKQKDGTSRQALQFRHVLNINFGMKF